MYMINDIWNEEQMPIEWQEGKRVTIHKKGDRADWKNYRGVTLLSTAYKVHKGKSTVDAIHLLKQSTQKAYEYNVNLEMMFVDFQQVFNSIKRNELITELMNMEVAPKLIRLINMTM